MPLQIDNNAPLFVLSDQTGKEHRLSDHQGKWVLIYFYPKDDTPGCTTEACAIRDHWGDFKKLNVQIFGISTDSVKSHARFAQKFNLPFALLADENRQAVNQYGVWGKKQFMGKEYTGVNRTSFLIGPTGKIAKIYEKVNPAEHAKEVLADIGQAIRLTNKPK